ncbi:hypothetical protein DYB28_003386 [Aphanomyces astaci]|uniref:Uncharacterized protein n=1 Tax=Aphanomyces astaci TaxID=112090 RepID=A0A9X8HHC4_APHAT|nr:hypothetical protein DYB28_003386 [Aphanomyces astaci]
MRSSLFLAVVIAVCFIFISPVAVITDSHLRATNGVDLLFEASDNTDDVASRDDRRLNNRHTKSKAQIRKDKINSRKKTKEARKVKKKAKKVKNQKAAANKAKPTQKPKTLKRTTTKKPSSKGKNLASNQRAVDGEGLNSQQMNTASANDLVAFADILREQLDRTHDADVVNQQKTAMVQNVAVRKTTKGHRITKHGKKANQAVRDQREFRGNYPEPPGGNIKPERSAAVWSPSTQKRTGNLPDTKYRPQTKPHLRNDDRTAQAARDEVRPLFAPGRDDRGMLYFVCQQPGQMARECPNKKDGDSADTSWKKGKNAVKRFKARERKANMQAKRMKKPPPTMDDDGRWVRLNNVLQPQLQVIKLVAPFVGSACNQMPSEASSYVDLTLKMQSAAGPVKVPGKRRYINRLLEQVARLRVDDDGDDLGEVGGDCLELTQQLTVQAASLKAVLAVAKNDGEGKNKWIASGVQLELTDGEKQAFDAVKSKL